MDRDLFATLEPPDARPGDAIAQVVVVCHANIARSPLAMAMLEAAARARLGPDASVWVRSAGMHARTGDRAASHTCEQARLRGLDLSTHRSCLLTARDLAEADLVITMSEQQRDDACAMHPPAASWTFTLPELGRLFRALEADVRDAVGGDRLAPRDRMKRVVALAARARPYVARPADPEDVADPFRGTLQDYADMAALVETEVAAIAPHLFGDGPSG